MKWFKSLSEAKQIAYIGGAGLIIAALVGAVITGLFQLANKTTPQQPTSIPQLKSFYSGTATGYTNGLMTFALGSEDPQGNVNGDVTFTIAANKKQARYSCQGQVTKERGIRLTCSEDTAPEYRLEIKGLIYQDGHMEGTMVARDQFSSYNHQYNWYLS